VINEDRHARTLAALQSLPARLRRILVLREVEGLPMGEAARRLGLSRHAVERRWACAIVLVSERLAEMGRGHAPLSPLVPAKAGTQESR
jgi:DNA-directed RNA polymerase specialized sigma24 family protein